MTISQMLEVAFNDTNDNNPKMWYNKTGQCCGLIFYSLKNITTDLQFVMASSALQYIHYLLQLVILWSIVCYGLK